MDSEHHSAPLWQVNPFSTCRLHVAWMYNIMLSVHTSST